MLTACADRSPQTDQPISVHSILGGLGDSPGRLAGPRAMDADGRRLWIIDRTARVQAIDPETGHCDFWFRMPEWEAGKPTGITVAPGLGRERLLYVADTHYHRVMIYDIPERPGDEAALVASFGAFGRGDGQFFYPTDVAVLTDASDPTRIERIYVSEYGGNDRISCFDGDFNFLFSFGSLGLATVHGREAVVFDRPQSVALVEINGRKELVTTDSGNHRLGRFTLDGELVEWLGGTDAGLGSREPGNFNRPFGLHALRDGTLLIVENGNNRVQRLDPASGECLGLWGRPGRQPGELAAPWAITVIDNRAFVLDTGNNRVVSFLAPRERR